MYNVDYRYLRTLCRLTFEENFLNKNSNQFVVDSSTMKIVIVISIINFINLIDFCTSDKHIYGSLQEGCKFYIVNVSEFVL